MGRAPVTREPGTNMRVVIINTPPDVGIRCELYLRVSFAATRGGPTEAAPFQGISSGWGAGGSHRRNCSQLLEHSERVPVAPGLDCFPVLVMLDADPCHS